LFITYGDKEKLKEKAVWFLRNVHPHAPRKAVKLEEPNDNEIIWGEITPHTIPQLRHLMKKVYVPFLN